MPRPTVFVSYARSDADWLERLQVHLKPLRRCGDLDLWDDSRIVPGDKWRNEVSGAIDRAAAAILLISADFLASDFIAREEIPPLLHKAQEHGTPIIPIVLQPCRFDRHAELSSFQSVNPPSQPLSDLPFSESERVFVQVAERIEQLVGQNGHGNGNGRHSRPGSHTRISGRDPSLAVFEDLGLAVVCLHLLTTLTPLTNGNGLTFSEVVKRLGIKSRKSAQRAKKLMEDAGWLTRDRNGTRTVIRVTSEGVRQLRRLQVLADASLQFGL